MRGRCSDGCRSCSRLRRTRGRARVAELGAANAEDEGDSGQPARPSRVLFARHVRRLRSAAVECAKLVIAQINPRCRAHWATASFISPDRLGRHVDAPLWPDVAPIGEPSESIGARGGLVDDGATLQLGIGGIPNAALAAMTIKRDLGVHTEMFSDGLLDLVEAAW